MKKIHLAFASIALAAVLTACSGNDSGTTTTSTSDNTTTRSTDSGTASTNDTSNKMSSTPSTATASKAPLTGADSTFVMKAAAGGMMEVEGGKTAQSNAQSDRVKAFGNMMVTDHSAANQELMSLASSHGLTVPSTLPADMQKHVDAMQKMKGKDFDSHYMSMMLNDHKKDVAEFEKESKSAKDEDLRAWATKTLPTLKAHLDSAQAISKGKM